MDEKPYLMIENPGGRRTRWYPHEYLEWTANHLHGSLPAHLDPAMLDPAQCRAVLPRLHEALDALARLVVMVEQRSDGLPAAICAQCKQRFYPLRSDARYCGEVCRIRAHRARRLAATMTDRPATAGTQ
jgi:hypothetical protein